MSLISNLHFPFKLKKDQEEAVKSWIDNNYKGSIIFSTGTGKTEIALECAKKASEILSQKKIFNVLFLVPRIILIEQNIKRLENYGIKKELVGTYYGEHKKIKEITISTYQSLVKNLEIIRNFDMIILDEVHLVSQTAIKYSKIFDVIVEHPSLAILCLTATIDEQDPKYSKILSLAPPVKKYSIDEAVNDGRLTKPRIIVQPVNFTNDEKIQYDQVSIKIKNISFMLRSSDPSKISKLLRFGGNKSRLAKQWFENVRIRKKLLVESKYKIDATVDIIQKHKNEKIMIFSETIESLEKISTVLNKKKILSKIITNKIRKKERQDILDMWGKNFSVLLSVHTLEIGFDIPSVRIAIIMSNTYNINQLVQRIGRVLRKSDNKEEALVYVVYIKQTKDTKIVNMLGNTFKKNVNKKKVQNRISSYFQ
ncbi:MAG: DEAD/DEAH box helicase [Nitrososphaeraceae archaeon]